jgi:hypothetical protein
MNRWRILSLSLILSLSVGMAVAPAEAGAFQRAKTWVNKKLKKSNTTVRATYTPPKLPVSVSRDAQGRSYGSFTPGVRTPVGRFGVSITRPIQFRKANATRSRRTGTPVSRVRQ